jgi:hypothetical protein
MSEGGEFEVSRFKIEVRRVADDVRRLWKESPVPSSSHGGSSTQFPYSSSGLPAPKGQPVKARGGTPGTTPPNVLRALKGHTEQGACGQRSPRWGEMS